MKQLIKATLSALMLLSGTLAMVPNCLAEDCILPLNAGSRVHTHINYRSQGANTAREFSGLNYEIYRPDMSDCYGVTTFAFEYTRSFRGDRIAQDWFGTNCLRFQGSEVTPRVNDALVAEYFGLGDNFSDSIVFDPRIENFIFDWNFFVGLDNWMEGLFLRMHFPLVYSRWTLFAENDNCLNNCNTTSATTTSGDLQCLFGPGDDTPAPVADLRNAFACGAPTNGQVFGANKSGCITPCSMDDVKLADIDLILGWLPYNTECAHLGIYLQYVAPTGTNYSSNYKYQGSYFAPQIGNGHHNELGAGITAHTVLWDDQDYRSLAFFVEGNITHMFANKQCRLFDLIENGPYSRYMLLREFDSNNNPTGTLIRANNSSIANKIVDVKIDAKVDLSFKLAYTHCNWDLDLGYNIYYHSKETLDSKCNIDCRDKSGCKYGVAGLTGTCCFQYDLNSPGGIACNIGSGTLPVVTSPISATISNANMFVPESGMVPLANVDTSSSPICLAWNSTGPDTSNAVACSALTADNGYRPIQGDLTTPEFLTSNYIDLDSGLSPEFLTHKIFGHINYVWNDKCGWNPFLGLGFEVEFDGNWKDYDCYNDCTTNSSNAISKACSTTCDRDQRVGINQWGLWIKGGINF